MNRSIAIHWAAFCRLCTTIDKANGIKYNNKKCKKNKSTNTVLRFFLVGIKSLFCFV